MFQEHRNCMKCIIIQQQVGGCTGTYYSLMREWNEEVFLCASGLCHVLLPVVKLIVAGLGASDELGEKTIL